MLRNRLTAWQNRKARQDYSAFAALVATPGDLSTGVTLPAAGVLLVSTTSVLAAVDVLVDAGARELGAPAAAANARHSVGLVERGVTVTKAAGAPGTVSLYVRDPAGVARKIAEG